MYARTTAQPIHLSLNTVMAPAVCYVSDSVNYKRLDLAFAVNGAMDLPKPETTNFC
jgi:hypothetical protein